MTDAVNNSRWMQAVTTFENQGEETPEDQAKLEENFDKIFQQAILEGARKNTQKYWDIWKED